MHRHPLLAETGRGPAPYLEPSTRAGEHDELFALWAAARAEANLAYDAWSALPAPETYASYRAAEDRADAAQDALAASGA